MREIRSRFDRAIDSIESFLSMDNASSIVLSLYKSDSARLSKRYPNLTFTALEAVNEPRRLYKYNIEKKINIFILTMDYSLYIFVQGAFLHYTF